MYICLKFLDFFHRLGGKEILWGKRNFGDCKRIFEQEVVEALFPLPLLGYAFMSHNHETSPNP